MTEKRVYIIHRWDGGPWNDFYPWLKESLEREGFEVILPRMPNTKEPTLESWIPSLLQLINRADEKTYFIGHSIGCQAILRYLETVSNQVGGVVLIAPWLKVRGLTEEENKIAEPWLKTPIDFDKIVRTVPGMKVLFSTNDPYVSVEDNRPIFEKKLHADVVVLEDKGHFTEDDGVRELPEILELLRSME